MICLLVWMTLLGGAAVLYAFEQDEISNALPECQFHEATGLYCPGCGTTRALYDLSRLRIMQAFGHNPFTIPAGLFLLAMLALETRAACRGRPGVDLRLNKYAGYGVVILVLGFMLLRNLPWWPFTILAP
ncbi:MAG: DUF2752 domain-containing protein [Candidatus Sumerlaeota bacterium]